jgi:DUF2075 family protein
LVTFHKTQIYNNKSIYLKDIFDIYVGLVCGRENIYKNENLGNIKVLVKENVFEKYILITQFPCKNEDVNKHLLKYKNDLIVYLYLINKVVL